MNDTSQVGTPVDRSGGRATTMDNRATWISLKLDALIGRIEYMAARLRRLLACAVGAVSVLAMPPFHLWPVLWLTLPLLCVAIDVAARTPERQSRWAMWRRWPSGRAAETGWWFGFGYHAAGLFWIGEAFLVEADVFAWLLPFAVTLLPAGLAFFTALAAASTRLIGGQRAVERLVTLAIGFGISEWLRGNIFTGFPWNVLGIALTAPLPLMQSAAVFGIYGLTVIAVVLFGGPFALLQDQSSKFTTKRRLWSALGLAVVPLAVMWTAGTWRLAGGTPPLAGSSAAKVRIVQLSIPQWERMQPENQRRIFDQHLAMSLTAPDGTVDFAAGIDVIIWPEAAMPFVPLAQPLALEAIGRMLPPGTRLISGALRVETDVTSGVRNVYNSLLAFEGSNGTAGTAGLVASYDKVHLVPFGEYLPAQGFLEAIGLQQITRQRGGFSTGSSTQTPIILAGLGRVLPLICYEAIFTISPQISAQRPELLLTITNDGWFGNTTGPRQHYHQARVRAVEVGIPMLRASSNGISVLIDGMGRESGRLELNAVGTIDVEPTAALKPTLFARFGDKIFLCLLLFLSGLVGFLRVRS